ncbi:MAG: hypothetical protein WA634_18335 [Silvibacterium sp.]
MSHQNLLANDRVHPKGPNFLLIVIMSCVVVLICIVGALLLVGSDGAKLLPNTHPRDAEPTSQLIQPSQPASPALTLNA